MTGYITEPKSRKDSIANWLSQQHIAASVANNPALGMPSFETIHGNGQVLPKLIARVPEPNLQMKCVRCEEEEKLQMKPSTEGILQMKSGNGGMMASEGLSARLNYAKNSGQPLPEKVSHEMGGKIGADFSGVKVHTGSDAIQMSREIGARAFTHGSDIYFNQGKYDPGSSEGKHLLAHELTHVVQQKGADQIQRTMDDGHDLRSDLLSEDPVLEACFDNERLLKKGATGTSVGKVQSALVQLGFNLPNFGVDEHFGDETQQAIWKYQKSRTLMTDGVIGPQTIGAMDVELPRTLPQVGPPSVPPVPSKGKSKKEIATEANTSGLFLMIDALPKLKRLKNLVEANQLDKATHQDAVTLKAVQFWLKVDVINGRAKFLKALDQAIHLVNENVVTLPHLVIRPKGHERCKAKKGEAFATAVVKDPNQVINVCEPFFAKGPICRRNVIVHERFHLVGVGHGEDAGGKATTQKSRTTEQALNSAHDLVDMLNDVLSQPMFCL